MLGFGGFVSSWAKWIWFSDPFDYCKKNHKYQICNKAKNLGTIFATFPKLNQGLHLPFYNSIRT